MAETRRNFQISEGAMVASMAEAGEAAENKAEEMAAMEKEVAEEGTAMEEAREARRGA